MKSCFRIESRITDADELRSIREWRKRLYRAFKSNSQSHSQASNKPSTIIRFIGDGSPIETKPIPDGTFIMYIYLVFSSVQIFFIWFGVELHKLWIANLNFCLMELIFERNELEFLFYSAPHSIFWKFISKIQFHISKMSFRTAMIFIFLELKFSLFYSI